MRRTEVVTAVLGLAYEVGRLRRIAPSYRSFTSCICIRWSQCAYRTKREICVVQRDKKGRLQSIKILQLHGFI